MTDPLDILGDLPSWPGKTPPKNRPGSTSRRLTSDDLNGARAKTYRIGGVDRDFFTVGELARALGKKPVTIRMWEQRGWIPKVKYRTPAPAGQQLPGKTSKGRRLYTREQVVFLSRANDQFNLSSPKKADWEAFRRHVRASWPAE